MIFSEGLNPWLLGECFWTSRSAKWWILSATLWTLTLHLETSRFWSLTIFRPNIKYHNTVTQIGIMIVIWYGSKGWYQFSSTVSPPFKKHDTSYLNDSYYFKKKWTLTLSAWPLRGRMALKSILWETLFLDQLYFFSLLSLFSCLHPFLKSKFPKKFFDAK